MRDLDRYGLECIDEIAAMGIDIDKLPIIEWTVSKRAKNQFGLCKILSKSEVEIRIAQFLLDEEITPDPDILKNTIIHELLHAIARGDGHGGQWKKLAEEVTKKSKGKYDIQRCATDEECHAIDWSKIKPRKIKYAIECPVCKTRWEYTRMCDSVRFPETYLHKVCGSRLVRAEI